MRYRQLVLSASAISTLKQCPWKFRNAYVHGIRPIEDAEPLRIGTLYHEGQELLMRNPESVCRKCANLGKPRPECFVCQGTGYLDDPMAAIARMLNYKYSTKYSGMDKDTTIRERAMIMYSLFAYANVYEEQDFSVISEELPFRIPLLHPDTHKPVEGIVIDGKIDKLIRWNDSKIVGIEEHKSTTNTVDPSSDYWSWLRLDTQVMMYIYACNRLKADGLLAPYGIKETDKPIYDALYDVWHKPQIKPKALSAAETGKFLNPVDDDGIPCAYSKYYNREFHVEHKRDANGVVTNIKIDGDEVPFTLNKDKKQSPVVRETEAMYGCRIFDQATENPEDFFGRKVLSRSADDMIGFERELYSLAMTAKFLIENDAWYHNEKQCDAFSKCQYRHLCYSGTQVDGEHVPPGFKNIFEGKKHASTADARRSEDKTETATEEETSTEVGKPWDE